MKGAALQNAKISKLYFEEIEQLVLTPTFNVKNKLFKEYILYNSQRKVDIEHLLSVYFSFPNISTTNLHKPFADQLLPSSDSSLSSLPASSLSFQFNIFAKLYQVFFFKFFFKLTFFLNFFFFKI